MARLFQINNRKITIFEWEFDILVVLLVIIGFVIGLYTSLSNILPSLFAGTATTITIDTDSDFTEGSLSSTEISGSGNGSAVQLSGGAGDWADASWQYRRPLTITSTNSNTLSEYQLLVTLTNGTFDYSNVKSDCADIRFGDTNGDFIPYYQISCDTGGTSEFWVQIPLIAANTDTTVYVYYGNSSAATASDETATFTYSSEKTIGYALHNTVNRLNVKSLADGNSISHNGSTLTLDEDDTGAFTSVDVDGAITATKLFGATDPDDDTDAFVPVSFAGTEILATSRDSGSGAEEFFILSPWGTASVTVYADGASCYSNASVGSTVVSTGGSCSRNDGTTYRITSSIPILAFMTENSTDPYPLHPSDTGPWYGTEGTRWSTSANGLGATVDYIYSGSASGSTFGVSSDRDNTINTGSQYGAGNAVKVVSQDNPITANQWADGNGGDAAI
ncbi:DUF2341 domain-containing protein, partial [candidate division WWE3 bacterium]|nr:DUF2341 domain-containing protein [candidate division WWE3 bacterium]